MRRLKHRRNIYIRNLALQRKIRRLKVKKRYKNILNNRPNPNKRIRVTRNPFTNKVENINIDGGKNFTLLEKPESVIVVVNALNTYKKGSRFLRNISIDLSKIESIDIGAINFLLAKINEFSKMHRVRISGNMPTNEVCKSLFLESGFLDYMTTLSGKRFTKNSENFILSIGSDKTLNEVIGKTIEKSMKFLTGNEQKYPPVYSIIQELCSNSVEWANPHASQSKNWLLGIYLQMVDNQQFITFALTDIGYGILNTLNRKFGIKVIESFGNIGEPEILMRAFERRYGSKSAEPNRNKGMPLVKDRHDRGYICNLKVITNNVLLDFCDRANNKVIAMNLPGTFYSWSINQKCLDKWNTKQLN